MCFIWTNYANILEIYARGQRVQDEAPVEHIAHRNRKLVQKSRSFANDIENVQIEYQNFLGDLKQHLEIRHKYIRNICWINAYKVLICITNFKISKINEQKKIPTSSTQQTQEPQMAREPQVEDPWRSQTIKRVRQNILMA